MELPLPTNYSPNLMSKSNGIDRLAVDNSFRALSASYLYACLICQQEAIYRMIPKSGVYQSAMLQDRGYVCHNCTKFLDNTTYALQHVSKQS